jgi:hypothetical protein
LYQNINQNNKLTTEQYGFRNNSSTEKTYFILINEILLALNNKLTVGGIFCGLVKAFYFVNHDILILWSPLNDWHNILGQFCILVNHDILILWNTLNDWHNILGHFCIQF